MRFGAMNLLDGSGEDLHEMEPANGDGGRREILHNSGAKGGGHVADDFGDTGQFAAVLRPESTERLHALPAFARNDEQHRSLGGVEIDEHPTYSWPRLAAVSSSAMASTWCRSSCSIARRT